MHMYCIEMSVNISNTRITRVNNICFCYAAISDDISTHDGFQVDLVCRILYRDFITMLIIGFIIIPYSTFSRAPVKKQ